jgi:hypothetical protein
VAGRGRWWMRNNRRRAAAGTGSAGKEIRVSRAGRLWLALASDRGLWDSCHPMTAIYWVVDAEWPRTTAG